MEIDKLESRIDELEERLNDSTSQVESEEAIDDLESRLDDFTEIYTFEELENRVDELESELHDILKAIGQVFTRPGFKEYLKENDENGD